MGWGLMPCGLPDRQAVYAPHLHWDDLGAMRASTYVGVYKAGVGRVSTWVCECSSGTAQILFISEYSQQQRTGVISDLGGFLRRIFRMPSQHALQKEDFVLPI